MQIQIFLYVNARATLIFFLIKKVKNYEDLSKVETFFQVLSTLYQTHQSHKVVIERNTSRME